MFIFGAKPKDVKEAKKVQQTKNGTLSLLGGKPKPDKGILEGLAHTLAPRLKFEEIKDIPKYEVEGNYGTFNTDTPATIERKAGKCSMDLTEDGTEPEEDIQSYRLRGKCY